MLFFALLTGLLVGVGLHHWYRQRQVRARRRFPSKWPLAVRTVVNSEERRVWAWLDKAMFDQQVLVKLPVTRFTAPVKRKDASHLFELLNNVHCTFTVCDMEGKVIACVDVHGPLSSKSNQNLKQNLLSQCGIRYRVLESGKLPHPTQIRFEFLGSATAKNTEQAVLDARFKDVKQSLQAALVRQRNNKKKYADPMDSNGMEVAEIHANGSGTDWTPNSFLTPLDSRRGDLNSKSAENSN
jgi:hypothetical protein